MMGAAVNIDVQSVRGPQTQREDQAVFHDRFARSRSLLHFTACRVLGSPERAELAVRNCWRRASRNPPRFGNDGAFRSWLLRLLIDEALFILHGPASRKPERTRIDDFEITQTKDPALVERVAKEHGIEILGPPLS